MALGCGRSLGPGAVGCGAARPQRRRRPAFTLIEMLVAMMVVGAILSGIMGMAYVLGNYHNEGEAAVVLATNGRFAMTYLGRDTRAAQAAGVSTTGGLVLWLGDLNANGQMELSEFVVYYKPSRDKVMRRMSFAGGGALGAIAPSVMTTVMQSYDSGMLTTTATTVSATLRNDIVCQNVDSLSFYANRAVPQTMSVECVLRLSRAQNVATNTGQTVALTLYETNALWVPYADKGFNPQY